MSVASRNRGSGWTRGVRMSVCAAICVFVAHTVTGARAWLYTAAPNPVLSLHLQWRPGSLERSRRWALPPAPRRPARRSRPSGSSSSSSNRRAILKPWQRRRRAPSSPRDRSSSWRPRLTWSGTWAARRERVSPRPCSSPRPRLKSGSRTAATSWRGSYRRTWRAHRPPNTSQRQEKMCNYRVSTKTAAFWVDVFYPCLSLSSTRLRTLRLTFTSLTLANVLACLMRTDGLNPEDSRTTHSHRYIPDFGFGRASHRFPLF